MNSLGSVIELPCHVWRCSCSCIRWCHSTALQVGKLGFMRIQHLQLYIFRSTPLTIHSKTCIFWTCIMAIWRILCHAPLSPPGSKEDSWRRRPEVSGRWRPHSAARIHQTQHMKLWDIGLCFLTWDFEWWASISCNPISNNMFFQCCPSHDVVCKIASK